MKPRRALLASLAGIVGLLWRPSAALAQGPTIFAEVWKSPTCGCCKVWITHLEGNGFRVKGHDVGNTAARARLKIAAKLGSCHTALVGRYAIEGHVPAADRSGLGRRDEDGNRDMVRTDHLLGGGL